ncbi:MAG: MBL fold metallo-hydrolase [Solirubrobacterales bacterium]
MLRRFALAGLAACALLAPASQAAASSLPPETVAAREHYFGAENVSPEGALRRDQVLLSWFSVASFAAAFDGHVVLLDTYIHKSEDAPGYVPTTTEELVDLKPEAIFLGHGHFDHADTAGEIAARTGATLIGTPEHCAQAREEAAGFGSLSEPVKCITAAASADAPGATRELDGLGALGEDVEVTALKHVHSAAEPPDGENHETSLVAGATPDPGQVLLHPPGPSVVSGLNPGGDEGGTVLYQFRLGGFSLTWNDSAGPLRERAPAVFDALRALPETDVQVGATLGFNDPTNGMRDPVDYMTTLEPDVFVAQHHDFVAEYGASKALEGVFRRELAKRDGNFGEVRWLYDPSDYLRSEVADFDLDQPRFSDCLARRAPVRPGNVAGVRLGRTREQIASRVGVDPVEIGRRSQRWCVRGSTGSVSAVFSKASEEGVARLVATTARSHRQRRLGAGASERRLLDRLPRADRIGANLYRAAPRSARLYGVRRGRVTFLAIANPRLLNNPRLLRRDLRRAGLK